MSGNPLSTANLCSILSSDVLNITRHLLYHIFQTGVLVSKSIDFGILLGISLRELALSWHLDSCFEIEFNLLRMIEKQNILRPSPTNPEVSSFSPLLLWLFKTLISSSRSSKSDFRRLTSASACKTHQSGPLVQANFLSHQIPWELTFCDCKSLALHFRGTTWIFYESTTRHRQPTTTINYVVTQVVTQFIAQSQA